MSNPETLKNPMILKILMLPTLLNAVQYSRHRGTQNTSLGPKRCNTAPQQGRNS